MFQVTSLQSQLSESVPTALLDQANKEHREMAVKYQRLLQLQTAYTASDANSERLQVRSCVVCYNARVCVSGVVLYMLVAWYIEQRLLVRMKVYRLNILCAYHCECINL